MNLNFVVLRTSGELVLVREHPRSSYSERGVAQFGTFGEALTVAEELGNATVCQLTPVAKVRTEHTRRVFIDPLLEG